MNTNEILEQSKVEKSRSANLINSAPVVSRMEDLIGTRKKMLTIEYSYLIEQIRLYLEGQRC